MNVEAWKQTTTIDLRRTHDIDLWTSGEITSEENGNGEAETPERKNSRSFEVNHDHPMEKDAWHLICNSGASS
jgi:hypothetical protein